MPIIRRVLSYFDHPAYDVIWGLMALAVIISSVTAIIMDMYAQMHGHHHLIIDSNLAILAGLPVAHFFGRISRHLQVALTSSISPSVENPTNLAFAAGDDPRFAHA